MTEYDLDGEVHIALNRGVLVSGRPGAFPAKTDAMSERQDSAGRILIQAYPTTVRRGAWRLITLDQ